MTGALTEMKISAPSRRMIVGIVTGWLVAAAVSVALWQVSRALAVAVFGGVTLGIGLVRA